MSQKIFGRSELVATGRLPVDGAEGDAIVVVVGCTAAAVVAVVPPEVGEAAAFRSGSPSVADARGALTSNPANGSSNPT